jgi:hypothetical protein
MLALLLAVALAQHDLIDEPVVRDFSRLLAKASLADRSREHGAFVVRAPNGTLYFVMWPPGDTRHLLKWYGAFPEGTVAILHTHPGGMPEPSKLDRRTARRTGLPVYVITPGRITRTTGGETTIVAVRWFDGEAMPAAGS